MKPKTLTINNAIKAEKAIKDLWAKLQNCRVKEKINNPTITRVYSTCCTRWRQKKY